MPDVSVTRWRRYGHDRLYVNGPGGARLGWCDLTTGDITVTDRAYRATIEEAVARWRAEAAPPALPPTPPTFMTASSASGPERAAVLGMERPPAIEAGAGTAPSEPEPAAPAEQTVVCDRAPAWEDLAERRPGQAARERAVELRRAAPVRTFLARMVGARTDERAWRIGADGEEMVAAQLAWVQRADPRWRVLHAVPVGANHADIDHVVIGPGGVYTLNAKHHPRANIWVAGETFMVNGRRLPYLRNARHEAERAGRLLTAASGLPVRATGVVVPVGARSVNVKRLPEHVRVIYRRRLAAWFGMLPPVLDTERIEAIYAAARRSTTWRTG